MVLNLGGGGGFSFSFFGQGWIFVVEFVFLVVCFTDTFFFFPTSNAGHKVGGERQPDSHDSHYTIST